MQFYETLLKAVEDKSSCRIEDIIKPSYQPARDMVKRCQMTRLIGHRLLLAIGDLCRSVLTFCVEELREGYLL